jgi:serine protease Do
MMQITEEGEYPFVELDRSDSTRLGDWVFSLGHSGGFDEERGVVVRLGRLVQTKPSTIQSDCNLIGGDSGGPLFDLNGRLIGIHSRVGITKEENLHVPMREFLKHWDGMMAGEFIGDGPFAQRAVKGNAFLGVKTEDREDGPGVLVARVGEESPAGEAGLEEGDVILKVDDVEIEDKEAFSAALKEKGAGDKISLTFLRDGNEETIEVELDER